MTILLEEQLLQRMREGERQAMAEFYRLTSPWLFAVCRRYVADAEDAKDVLHESFVNIFTSIHSFQPKHHGALAAWARRIAVNSALNHIRRNRRLTFVSTDMLADDVPDEEIDAQHLPADVLQQLLEQLPTGYRTVFNLFAIEEMCHREIGNMLGISAATSASQYHRAKRMLKSLIKKHLESTT